MLRSCVNSGSVSRVSAAPDDCLYHRLMSEIFILRKNCGNHYSMFPLAILFFCFYTFIFLRTVAWQPSITLPSNHAIWTFPFSNSYVLIWPHPEFLSCFQISNNMGKRRTLNSILYTKWGGPFLTLNCWLVDRSIERGLRREWDNKIRVSHNSKAGGQLRNCHLILNAKYSREIGRLEKSSENWAPEMEGSGRNYPSDLSESLLWLR